MSKGLLEHVNFTVSNAEKTANFLCDIFAWEIRWQGPSLLGGYTYHVGRDEDYLAVYQPASDAREGGKDSVRAGGLNHIGVQVDDIDATEEKVKAAGFTPFNHDDYDPGKRFYFLDDDGIEFEVVSYAS